MNFVSRSSAPDALGCERMQIRVHANVPNGNDDSEKMTYDQERAEARDDLGRHAGTAITDASNSADLELAIKEFYAAAWSYCEAPSDATDVEYEAKKKALDEMLQSAGR
jgi:hypothetical protein